MHKILVTSQAIRNDNADNCLNVLQSICQRDDKDDRLWVWVWGWEEGAER